MSRFSSIQSPAESSPTATPAAEEFGVEFYLKEGDAALARGRYESALKSYGRALERDRENQDAWYGQARALVEMGHSDVAFTWLEQAGQTIGETPRVLALRAISCARRALIEEALAWSDRAMRGGNDDAEVWLSRAEVLYAGRRNDVAAATLKKAAERTPTTETRRRCGEVALYYGDLGAARVWLERASRENPEDPLAALHLGVLAERYGDDDKARGELMRALNLQPGLEAAKMALATLDNRSPWERFKQSWRKWNHG